MVNDYAINYGNLCTTTAVYSAHQFYAEVFLLNSMSKIQTELNLSISGIFSNLLFMCSNPTAIKSSLIFRQVTMSTPLKRLMLKCVSLRPKRYKTSWVFCKKFHAHRKGTLRYFYTFLDLLQAWNKTGTPKPVDNWTRQLQAGWMSFISLLQYLKYSD